MQLIKTFPEHKYNLFMLDLETNGRKPGYNGITSVCIVHFSGVTGVVLDKLHFKFDDPTPAHRVASPKTLKWRGENHVGGFEASLRTVNVEEGLDAINEFLHMTDQDPVLFAKHPDFDVTFIREYMEDNDRELEIKHSRIYDVDSITLGAKLDKTETLEKVLNSLTWDSAKALHFDGKNIAHDAFYDCVLQVHLLMESMK